MGLHSRINKLYGTNITLASDERNFEDVEQAFNNAAKHLHETGSFTHSMLKDAPIRELINQTTSVLRSAISLGFGEGKPSADLQQGLKENAFVFSGFKTFHEMKEASSLLVDEKGDRKPFNQYLNDIQKINSTYNKHYLSAEYDHAIGSAEMASKWDELSQDEDRYNLQYRTAGDGKVRKAHAALAGTTLPASDPFWNNYYPPNSWGCRCTVVQVRKSKYAQSDSKEAIKNGESATSGKHQEMFRVNVGKQQSAFPAYNSYTIKKCDGCNKKKNLASNSSKNELCAACGVIHDIKSENGFKEATKKAYTWISDNIEERGYQLPATKQAGTFDLRVNRGSLKDIVDHFKIPDHKMLVKDLVEALPNRTYSHTGNLGEGKKGDAAVIEKNLKKKKARGVVKYNYYDVEIKEEPWLLNCEVFKGNYEKPYALNKKRKH